MSKESNSNKYVLDQIERVQKILDDCKAILTKNPLKKTSSHLAKQIRVIDGDYRNDICNKIKECEEAEKIEVQVLDKTSAENRILLPFYICLRYFPQQRLSTGDIEKITSEIGVRVKTSNVAKTISEKLWRYLDSSSTRVKWKVTLYKLNRKGEKYFLSILNNHVD